MSNLEYFIFDPDWEAYASKNGLPIPSNDIPPPGPIVPIEINWTAARSYQASADAEWDAANPLESVGYRSHLMKVTVRDGAQISVKVSYPDQSRLKASGNTTLPVLFVTHGGGWISGSHISEEAWILRHLYEHFDLVIVSVEYRLGPENRFPVWINDSWDILEKLISDSESFVSGLDIICNLQKLILVGSSSGATISAALSQSCREKGLEILGVVLNVPVLCDYRHFPSENRYSDSYMQCTKTFLDSGQLAALWNMVHPSSTSGSDPKASPLLGNTDKLPPHLIFVAGRDPIRDEGIAYARKLEKSDIPVKLNVYKGVPHNFAQYAELKSTLKFREDFKAGLEQWVPSIKTPSN
jgi:acetyl esterase/lipase